MELNEVKEKQSTRTGKPSSRIDSIELAITAMLAAVYVSYTILSSYVVGAFTRGMDTFIVQSLLFVVLVAFTNRRGLPTLKGFICGLVIELLVPAHVRFYLLPSVFAYGLVFDLLMNYPKRETGEVARRRVIVATAFASAVMSSVVFVIFGLVGVFPPAVLPVVWLFRAPLHIVLGIVGAIIGYPLAMGLTRLKSPNVVDASL
jgi:hypothetical protein